MHLITSDMYGSVVYDKYSCQITKQIKASKEGEGDYVTYNEIMSKYGCQIM